MRLLMTMTLTNAFKKQGKSNQVLHKENCKALNQYNMTPLITKETWVGLKKNQNLRTDLSPDPNPVEVLLKTVSTVALVTNVDNAKPMGKL